MTRRSRNIFDSEREPEKQEPAKQVAATPPAPTEERPLRKGRVRVRALRSCVSEGMAYYVGDVFTIAESELSKRVTRGDVEPI